MIDPALIARFDRLVERAGNAGLRNPTAAALATGTPADGRLSVRYVLLRGWDTRGFVFFTNENSLKGRQLAAHPRAALALYWEALEEQVRIEGPVETVTDEENDAYWATRPRMSRLGAVASDQSSPLDSRATFETRLREAEAAHPGDDIPRPAHWHGYRVCADRLEFWIGRDNRLHERETFELRDGGWRSSLLFP